MRKTVFMLFALSLTTLAIVHFLALAFYLYWIYPLLDIPMHLLGGATVALGYQSRFALSKLEHRLRFDYVTTLAAVLAVGVLWELYEVVVGPMLPGYVIDTLTDIVMDMLGATLGYIVARAVIRL